MKNNEDVLEDEEFREMLDLTDKLVSTANFFGISVRDKIKDFSEYRRAQILSVIFSEAIMCACNESYSIIFNVTSLTVAYIINKSEISDKASKMIIQAFSSNIEEYLSAIKKIDENHDPNCRHCS